MTVRILFNAVILAASLSLAGTAQAATAMGAAPMASQAQTPGAFKVAQRRCRSVDSILDRLARRGYYNFQKVKVKTATMKVRAFHRGVRYRIKLDNCTGRMIWREPMK